MSNGRRHAGVPGSRTGSAGTAHGARRRGIDFDAVPPEPSVTRHPAFPVEAIPCQSRRSRTCTSTPSTRCWTVPRG
ncbi:hypothetical protein SGPA1_31274 [Streptomyces misionensis JCM 4497]